MTQKRLEASLTTVYALTIVCGIIACVTSGIAWGHWKGTLDQCGYKKNCSCILYAKHTPYTFLGGDPAPCIWVSFGPLIYMFFGLAMFCFHGYRIMFTPQEVTRTITTTNESGETVVLQAVQKSETSSLPRKFWIVISVFSTFFTLYSLIHFSIYCDGFLSTCKQYRKTLERILSLSGTALPVIHSRLNCKAIFDFMDYVQPDSINSSRDGFINTGVDLILGIIASFISFVSFGTSSFINIRLAKSKTV